MKEILEAIAAEQVLGENQFGFHYARRDYANLEKDMPIDKVQIFLDPVQITEVFGEYNELQSKEYSGSFLVLISSDVEKGDYNLRYTDEIKPILDGAVNVIKDSIRCTAELSIQLWRTTEVINMFGYNLDGVLITYSTIEDE